MVDRCGTALEIFADAAELRDKLRGLGDRVISLCILIESLDQFRVVQIIAAVFAKVSVLRGIFLQIVVIIAIFVHVVLPF